MTPLIVPTAGFTCAHCHYALTPLGNGVYFHDRFWGECPNKRKTFVLTIDKGGALRLKEKTV